jgi:hypothetical protein
MEKPVVNNAFMASKPKDLTTVNSSDMAELLWWSYSLGVTPEKLLSVIRKYGIKMEVIKFHLKE